MNKLSPSVLKCKGINVIPIKAIMLNTDTVWDLFLENKQITLNNLLVDCN